VLIDPNVVLGYAALATGGSRGVEDIAFQHLTNAMMKQLS
jgi:hypothetical protein